MIPDAISPEVTCGRTDRAARGRLVAREPDPDGNAVPGNADVGRRPVTRDHGEHPPVGVQDVHRKGSDAPGLGSGDQRAHQRRAEALAPPGVGDHYADIGHAGAAGLGPVRRHGVPDDDAVPDGDQGMDVGVTARQQVKQGGGRRDRAEESQVASSAWTVPRRSH